VEPRLLESLPEATWKHWASLILVFPSEPVYEKPQEHLALRKKVVDLASQHAPVDVMRSFRCMLAPQNRGPRTLDFIADLHGCWTEMLLELAWQELRDPGLSLSLFRSLLVALLLHQHDEARAHAEALLFSKREASPKLRTVVASVLLACAPERSWKTVWPLLESDVDYGRRVLDDLARNGGQAALLGQRFTPEQAVDLFVWIERHGGEETTRPGDFAWSRRGPLHEFKSYIWALFSQSGSAEVCRALERLVRELPGQRDLRVLLLRAQEALRLRQWQPPSPEEILKLVGSRQARVVQSGVQLLEVLLESLERLQAELHGETPALKFLWNESREENQARFKPKKENDLSDWIKHHLEKELADRRIIVNREVEIRPSEPSRKGQRIDLLVEAIARLPEGREERISVIIEVKGCWNPELWTAMKGQLVDRYLAENDCRHGIYLVGWYACDYWNETTSYPPEGRVGTLERARQLLEEQARTLSKEGLAVRAFVLDAAFRSEQTGRGRRGPSPSPL
jgi:hypothetical protein